PLPVSIMPRSSSSQSNGTLLQHIYSSRLTDVLTNEIAESKLILTDSPLPVSIMPRSSSSQSNGTLLQHIYSSRLTDVLTNEIAESKLILTDSTNHWILGTPHSKTCHFWDALAKLSSPYNLDLPKFFKYLTIVHFYVVGVTKCEFHRTTVTFLGYIISPRGAEMDTNKVRAVSEWPAPSTIKELQRFLGFTNFYWRFIRNYSLVAAPLTSLLRGKPKKLNWTDQARADFQQLKDCFTTAPILCHPDPDRLFVVEVDASSSGLRAVLSQRHGDPGKVHPCAFYSQKLTTAEVKYDVGNRKLLAIKATLEEWCHWLEGACHPFQVLTDHRNLEYLCGAKRPNPRQARWALFFTQFQFTVSYRPGSKNGKTDSLSRQSEAAGDLGQPELILPATALLALLRWDLLGEIRRPVGLLEPLPVPRRPWSHLSVDFLTDLPDSGGFMAIMVVVDRFSKGCKLVPLKGLPTAMQTVDAMFAHVFRNFGLPEDTVSDRGPQFTSRVWRALCARLDIGVSLSSSHHPQSNGQAERLNQEIGRFLRSYCSREQQRWSEFLPWAEYAQNSLTHSSTGLTPFQCVLGYQPPLFPWSGEPSSVPAVEEWYRRSQEFWEWAHVWLQRAVRRQRIQADQHRRPYPAYQVGQMVWLSTRNLRLKLPCRKLSPKFIGPFEIVRQPVHASAGESVVGGDPPLPLDIEGSPAYQVRSLLDSRRLRSRLQYLMDWEGYGPEKRSWMDASDILDPSLIEDFHRDHPTRPAPRPRGRPRRRTPEGVPRGGGSVTTQLRSDHERELSPAF
ncbi:hypothetical protein QTP70_027791, partial [Hemibagrus guttatus]